MRSSGRVVRWTVALRSITLSAAVQAGTVTRAGIVLINTAGSADTGYNPDAAPAPGKPRSKAFVNATSWLTFQYLQRGIANQLKKLYPTRPYNADKFLNDEIYRASCDPCALQVIRSTCLCLIVARVAAMRSHAPLILHYMLYA